MGPIRTFVAVEVPEEIRQRAQKVIRHLQKSGASVKWVAPENLHLTLKFVGDVTHAHIADVCRAVQAAAKPFAPFTAGMGGVGAFPSLERPRTIWIGMPQGDEPFVALQQAIEQSLDTMGYPAEQRRFHPHLTLGRVRGGRGLSELAERIRDFDDESLDELPVDEVLIFSSQLERRGPIYDVLGRGPLKGQA